LRNQNREGKFASKGSSLETLQPLIGRKDLRDFPWKGGGRGDRRRNSQPEKVKKNLSSLVNEQLQKGVPKRKEMLWGKVEKQNFDLPKKPQKEDDQKGSAHRKKKRGQKGFPLFLACSGGGKPERPTETS